MMRRHGFVVAAGPSSNQEHSAIYKPLMGLFLIFLAACGEPPKAANSTKQIVGVTESPSSSVLLKNKIPVPKDDNLVASANQALLIKNLLANDIDPDGRALKLVRVDTLSKEGGSVVTSYGNNIVTYTPVPQFQGQDSFNYSVADDRGATASARVLVRVTDAGPATANPERVTPGIANEGLTSYAQTLYPLLRQRCVPCHSEGTSTLPFAAEKMEFAYATTITGNIVDLTAPQASLLVSRLRNDLHSCWSDCNDNAVALQNAIAAWATLSSVPAQEANAPPVPGNDQVKTIRNQPLTNINVLANDRDPENGKLIVTAVTGSSQQNGSVEINGNGTLTYRPPPSYWGPDSFTYTLSDSQGDSAQAIVDINVERGINIPPLAEGDVIFTYPNIQATSGDIVANDFDGDGDLLTITTFDSISKAGGKVTTIDTRRFTYTPPPGFIGNDSFTYKVADGLGGIAAATVAITVQPHRLRDENRFLQFINAAPGNMETATAYYRAVDPLNQRTTIEAWRRLNGFTDDSNIITAVYYNSLDLGFGRRMHVRTDRRTQTVAAYVENYTTLPDAINKRNLIATVAMEYTVAPGENPLDPQAHRYTTFYAFDSGGRREPGADLDGRGFKFLPEVCNTCHGGKGKLLENGIYPNHGDTGGGFLPWDVDALVFSRTDPEFSRTAQENKLKAFNQIVMEINPTAAQRELIQGWYGGANLSSNVFNGRFIPQGWLPPAAPAGADQLYTQVVAPACRSCHAIRGSDRLPAIAFSTYNDFVSYKEQTEYLTFDKGVMPLALRTFNYFWNTPASAQLLVKWLNSNRLLGDGQVLKPGRALANPGPSRSAPLGTVELNGAGSLFYNNPGDFHWQLLNKPPNSAALLLKDRTPETTFIADAPGDYSIGLTVDNPLAGIAESPAQFITIRVDAQLKPLRFNADIAPLFTPCTVCHQQEMQPDFRPNASLYATISAYINKNEPSRSPILTKPAGEHHNGGKISGFEAPLGQAHQRLKRWILEGATNN